MRLVAAADVPGVDLRLQLVAAGEQGAILGAKLVHEGGEAGPEPVGSDSRAGQGAGFDEIGQRRVDLQAVKVPPISHLRFLVRVRRANYEPRSG